MSASLSLLRRSQSLRISFPLHQSLQPRSQDSSFSPVLPRRRPRFNVPALPQPRAAFSTDSSPNSDAAGGREGLSPVSAAGKKPVCDPYGQDGKYLDLETVQEQMKLLHRGWKYDEDSRRLERSFVVCSPETNPSQRQKALKAYRFTQLVGVISDNLAHQVYGLQIKPRAAQVTVQLKTIPLRGLSYNDFFLAMRLDATCEQVLKEAPQ